MTSKLKKIITTLILIGLLFVVYVIFVKEDPTSPDLISDSSGARSGDAQLLGNQISQALLRIEQIKLDKTIFNNTLYKKLVDRSEPISEEPIGRSNPFAPLGANVFESTIRTSGTTTSSLRSQASSTAPATSTSSTSSTTPPVSQPVGGN